MLNFKSMAGPIRRNPQIGIMLSIVALVMSGNGFVAPMLSAYASTFGASSTLAGMVITVFGVARLFVNYPAGALSQRHGRRPLLGAGLSIIAVGSVGAALAHTIEWLLFWRFVQGAGSGIYMTVAVAAMADLARRGDRAAILSMQQAATWLGAGLGPAVGGFLAEHMGISAPFWAYAVVGGTGALLVSLCLNETAASGDSDESAADSPEVSVSSMDLPVFSSVCFLYFMTFFTRTASQWLLIPQLAIGRHKMGMDTVGVALTVLVVGTFALLPVSAKFINRYGAGLATEISVLITAAALMVMAVGEAPEWFWIGIILLGVGMGGNSSATSVLAVDILPRQRYGHGIGMLRTFGDAGFVVGPIVVGILGDFSPAGPVGGLTLNALLLTLSVVIFAFVHRRSPVT